LSVGGYFSQSDNHVLVDASYKKKPEGIMLPSEPLSNDFIFHQSIGNLRASVRYNIRQDFSFTIGNNAEHTSIKFDLLKTAQVASNGYWTWLPFFNLNRTWKEKLSITLSYRRTINRPGINEMNPSIDYSDPYNIRFGNSNLTAATSHNFDLVFGRVKPKYFVNLGFGHNIVQDVFSQVRSLTDQGKTQITYENISGRKEYEMSSWNGITLSKKFRMNLSASMTRLQYSSFDRIVRKFRNGTSLTSTFGYSYNPTDLISFTGNFNLNRFASPQGFAKWSTSLNIGLQKKFLHKKLIVSLNAIDPLTNQKRRTFTYGTNFNLENYSLTYTRNYRATIAYTLSAKPKKLPAGAKSLKKK
jgi:outer membrane receptor protein involved in Fe transport